MSCGCCFCCFFVVFVCIIVWNENEKRDHETGISALFHCFCHATENCVMIVELAMRKPIHKQMNIKDNTIGCYSHGETILSFSLSNNGTCFKSITEFCSHFFGFIWQLPSRNKIKWNQKERKKGRNAHREKDTPKWT